MPLESPNSLAGIDIPQDHGAIFRAGEHGLAIGVERDAADHLGMAFEAANGLTGGNIPENQCLIVGSGYRSFAVGAEGYAVDATFVSCEDAPCAGGVGRIGQDE